MRSRNGQSAARRRPGLLRALAAAASACLLTLALRHDASAALVRGDDVPLDYPVFEIAAADFNGNGAKDLALTRPHSVVIFRGRGDGTFKQAGRFSVGKQPSKLLVADLNRDGDKDLVTSNFESDNVSVLIGRGDGTFRKKTNYRAGDGPSDVDVGKLNGGRRRDLAVTNLLDNDVSIFLGRRNGAFRRKRDRAAGYNPRDVAIARLNGDRTRDLAIADVDRVKILKGRGDGTFRRGREIVIRRERTAGFLNEVLATRLNRGRRMDLLVSGIYSCCFGGVYSLLGRGNGTFRQPKRYFGSGAMKIAVADLVGGPRKDLIVVTDDDGDPHDPGPGSLYVHRGRNGDFTLTGRIIQELDGRGGRFAIADLNGDGSRDVAALTYAAAPKIEIFLNR
jgi:hypothetical protein